MLTFMLGVGDKSMKGAVELALAAGVGLAAITLIAGQNAGKTSATPGGVLSRHYDECEKLTYHMTGSNQQWRYKVDANGVVKKEPRRGNLWVTGTSRIAARTSARACGEDNAG
jgi:hypothetical protein